MICFQTKNPFFGVNSERALKGKMLVYFMAVWNILRPLGIYYGHLVMLWQFGIFFPVLVYCDKKNLATLVCPVLWEFFFGEHY
jgi:hypothetical protein